MQPRCLCWRRDRDGITILRNCQIICECSCHSGFRPQPRPRETMPRKPIGPPRPPRPIPGDREPLIRTGPIRMSYNKYLDDTDVGPLGRR
jgi:hypothetical protein